MFPRMRMIPRNQRAANGELAPLLVSSGVRYESRWVLLPWGKNIQRLNVYFYYECGQAIKDLESSAKEGASYTDLAYPYYNTVRWLDSLIAGDSLALEIVRAPVKKLKAVIDE